MSKIAIAANYFEMYFKLFKPSYADLVKNLFGSSAARSLDIGYLYGNQPKRCQNDVFLENGVPIDRFL